MRNYVTKENIVGFMHHSNPHSVAKHNCIQLAKQQSRDLNSAWTPQYFSLVT
jgi:hypothetical protein